jgi:cytochrome oxidase assembly protein ShyY1
MTPQKHRAYAVQWYALALLGLVCWAVVGWRRGTEN